MAMGRIVNVSPSDKTTREFVVNLVSAELGEVMSATAAALPHDESEFERFTIESLPSDHVKPPRVSAAPISFEC